MRKANQQVVQVFLASPSDLNTERQAVRELAQSLNRGIGVARGWEIELLGWEDALPGHRRPQELINADVDKCDIFVGMLWRRWGSPTGDYSSGFEEEYERAADRRRRTGVPEILLLFKPVDPELKADPGLQLTEVLGFRQRIEQQALYGEFAETSDLMIKLAEYLPRYVDGLMEDGASGRVGLSPEPSVARPGAAVGGGMEAGSAQLVELFESLRGKSGDESQEVPSDEEIARLALIARSWVTFRYSDELLETHEAGLAYRCREAIKPTPPEASLILRSMLADRFDVVAGWYWFDRDESQIRMLKGVAKHDALARVRARALELLMRAGVSLEREQALELARLAVVREADANEITPLGWLARDVLTSDDLADLAVGPVREQIGAILDLAHQPASSVGKVLSQMPQLPASVVEPMLDAIDSAPLEVLREAIGHGEARISERAVRSLVGGGGTLDPADFSKDRAAVRSAVFDALAERGFDSVDALETAARVLGATIRDEQLIPTLRHASDDALVESLDWLSASGWAALRVLSARGSDVAAEFIREGLETGFSTLAARFKAQLDSYPAEARASLGDVIEPGSGLYNFLRTRWISEALRLAQGSAVPVEVVRQYISSDDLRVQRAAIEAIAALGEGEDIEQLLPIAAAPGPNAAVAARVATVLADEDHRGGCIAVLLDSSSAEVRMTALEAVSTLSDGEAVPIALGRLQDGDSRVRTRAVLELHRRDADLEAALESQLEHRSYYYNVVCWIDRLRYTSEALARAFVAELGQTAQFPESSLTV